MKSGPTSPPTLEAACLKALAKDPVERFQTASELGHEVEQWQEVQRRKAEVALRESEALYRSLVDMLPLILVRKDLNSRFTFANGRACESFGEPLEEILGKTDFDFHPQSLAESSVASDREIFKSGRTVEYPPFWCPDRGRDRCFESIKTPVRDAKGRITGVQIVIWDVTERIELEEALRESEALYRSLVDVVPLILVRKGLDYRFTFVNRRFCEAIGKPLEEIVGKTDADFFPKELTDEYFSHDRKVFRSRKTLEFEETFIEKGERRDIRVIKSPTFDAKDELNGVQIIVWDVTEQKRLQEQVRESEALYHSLVETLPLSVWRKDEDGRFIFGNKRFCESFGQTLEGIIGKTDYDFFPEELAEKYRQDDERVHQTGESYATTEEHVSAEGERLYVEVVKTPVRNANGELTGTQGIFWDLTTWKELEEALARERDLLHALMDNVPDRIHFKDAKSRFILVNQMLADFMGFRDPADAVGKTDADIFTSEHAVPAREDELCVMQTGEPIIAKVEKETWPDGKVTWVSTTKVPFRSKEGEIIGTLGISRQIPPPTDD